MKLTGRDAAAYLRKPDAQHAGMLIYGADPMRVSDKRQEAVKAIIGPDGDAEMRLTRIDAADLRKDAALVNDAIKAQGFFPGARVVLVEDATDGMAPLMADALAGWAPGDAQIVLTAGQLAAKSALRKVFEAAKIAVAIGIYDDPPTRDDIVRFMGDAGLAPADREVMDAIFGLAQTLEPGDFRQTLEKVALYTHGAQAPLAVADVMACAPLSADVEVDDILDVVTAGDTDKIAAALRNLYAQGVAPVTLCIGAMRHFRRMHQVASDPGGPAAGVGKLRPPLFGPRRDRLARQAGQWGRERIERAITALTDTDLQMRSAQSAPPHAVMERTLIRLAIMARRG